MNTKKRNPGQDWIRFDAEIIHETPKAILFLFYNGREMWVPRSAYKEEMKDGFHSTYVKRWVILKNNMGVTVRNS